MKKLFDPEKYLPIINGLIGDKLAEKKDKWALPMSFRVNGKSVSVEDLDKKLLGKNTVIFVHGLMADERIWKSFKHFDKKQTVLYVRYNTGLHISENGQLLAELLNRLEERSKMRKIHLIGHSMGGLVVRSAGYYGVKASYPWTKKVASVFLIAVPNAGAALEQLGHITTSVLTRIANWHTRVVGGILNQRSNGIKDLRLGCMVEEDWNPIHGKLATSTQRCPVPPLPGVPYHIIIGSLSKEEDSLLSRYFGDGLVTPKSAVGVTLLKTANVKTFVRTGHNSILSHAPAIDYIHKLLK